jgi:UDP-glucose 4-epimerase
MVLVTGGTGYIGSHTVVELQKEGYDVLIIDDLSNSRIEVLDAIETISGKRPLFAKVDVTDKEQLEVFSVNIRVRSKGVIHFAAKKAVGESVSFPLMYYRINVNGLLNSVGGNGRI